MVKELTKEDIIKINGIIEGKEVEKIQKETKLEEAYKYVKANFDCDTLDEIEEELDASDKKIEGIETQIKDKSKTLSESYNWTL